MKNFSMIISVLAILSLLSTLICGMWIKQQAVVEASSISFHTTLGMAAVCLAVLSIILLMISK